MRTANIETCENPTRATQPTKESGGSGENGGRAPALVSMENIRRHVDGEGICVMTFDRPGSSANIFDEATFSELNAHLDYVETHSQIKGVIFTSAKESVFIAGADLHALSNLAGEDSAQLLQFIEIGQNTFSRIANLPVPTAAAIHGACLGGGYELCLACDCRVASGDRVTKIGLPETQLGILPAWGGSSRLPRLIGVPRALDVILTGKTLAAPKARKLGMVDEVLPREALLDFARRRLLQKGLGLRRRAMPIHLSITNSTLVARLTAAYVRSKLWRVTRGHYPAPYKALEVVSRGVSHSLDKSLALEAASVCELAKTQVCRNLVQVFFLQERAKKLSGVTLGKINRSSANLDTPVRRCAVIGAGVMGAGIAQWVSARGLPVILKDIQPDFVRKGMESIGKLYGEGVRRRIFTKIEARAGMDRIYPTATDVPLAGVDLVIEAAVEKMKLKQDIFRKLDQMSGDNTILATNTSALSVSELASVTSKPEKVVGIHFFNPVHRMQLVEVVTGKQTSAETVLRTLKFIRQIGKLPVVVKDSPGFLVNRILMPYLIEAVRLFENGASVESIDQSMLDFGMPMGPLRLIDEVGADVSLHVAKTLEEAFPGRIRLPGVLDKMLEAGLVGRKGRRGFYCYDARNPEVNSAVKLFQTIAAARDLTEERLQNQMVLLMVNEAARCLEEELVTAPEDVDFAMIMGTGFAPFRGGLLRHADAIGVRVMVEEMLRLASIEGGHFKPCEMLKDMANRGGTFYSRKGGDK